MSKLFNVSTNPHIVSKTNTSGIMLDVILALAPAAAFGVWQSGFSAAVLLIACMAACVASEYVWEKCMKKPITTGDYSALLTGLLIGMNVPPTLPVWMAIIGSVFAIVVVKQLFGGLGQNFANPALAGRCFLLISFAGPMTTFLGVDGVSTATPLAVMKANGTIAGSYSLQQLFIGTTPGVIGETSAVLLLLGGLYLIWKKVITWDIPVVYIATVAVFAFLFGQTPFDLTYTAAHVFGGGLMLGAFFMATDYVTSPITKNGRILYAVAIGLLTGIFRIFGSGAEGVSYAILLGNILVPLIEKVTMPKPFGREGEKK